MPTDNYNNRSVVVRVPNFSIARGQDGLSAYEQAVLGGYTGTEAQFNQELSSFKTLHDETVTNATAAAASASSAGQSATAAAGSAENAASSASSSASSASAASASAGSAADSASSAASSAASAAASAASAGNSASTATEKASEASASATAAGASETNAASSEDAAADSAAAAAASAAAIEEYEHDAEAWAIGKRGGQDVPSTDATYHNNAKYYADQAGTSASTAASSAAAASTSENNSASSASSAAGSASSATTSAATATEKAGEAATSASAASTSAASAAGSATNAASSATAASASATAAGNAQTAAETAQGKAEDAQEAAETAAQSVSESAEQIATNTQDISDLKSAINYYASDWGWQKGYITTGGINPSTGNDRYYSKLIDCIPNSTIYYVAETDHSNVSGLTFYKKDGTPNEFHRNEGTSGAELSATVPNDSYYFRLSINITKVPMGNCYARMNANYVSQVFDIAFTIAKRTGMKYVNGTSGVGNNSNDGTLEHPYRTIQHAVDQGAETIIVYPMIYNESVVISSKRSINITPWWGSTTTAEKIVIDGTGHANALKIENVKNVVLEHITFQNSTSDVVETRNSDNVEITECDFVGSSEANGISFYNSVAKLTKCTAHDNGNDGFGIHYAGNVTLVDCKGYDNSDDGVSHHQASNGAVIGGEYYGNGKGGIASPTYGSKVNIYNAYCHNNKFGIYADATSMQSERCILSNCCLTNNVYGMISQNYTWTLMGNHFSSNQTDIESGSIPNLNIIYSN